MFGNVAVDTAKSGFLNPKIMTMAHNHVEVVNSAIIRRVKVNRNRTPEEVLKATGRHVLVVGEVFDGATRKSYQIDSGLKCMPHGEGDEVEIGFFNFGCAFRRSEQKDLELHGLVPADPYSLSAVNEADPDFADTHPNYTYWRFGDGRFSFILFDRWHVGRVVVVSRDCSTWAGQTWLACFPKQGA